VQDILDRRFRYIRLQTPTSSVILWTSLTRQPMLSASCLDDRGRPGELRFFFKLIKLGSKRFGDRTVSSICTEEIVRHPYSGLVFGQRHDTLCFLLYAQLTRYTTTESVRRKRMGHTRKLEASVFAYLCEMTSRAQSHFRLLTKVITDRNWVHHCRRSFVIQVNWFLADSHWWP